MEADDAACQHIFYSVMGRMLERSNFLKNSFFRLSFLFRT